ncbi:FAD-dependent oxidoreductase [Modestobacter sp. I12A-02662]|uniref:FAD-dependent oxidoreductase n=1 Tax=Modestobacter sp. I12A-02662 TaxID=1730496 RepID=UPI0034DFE4F8
MSGPRVAVVGGGVIGLTIAAELALAGTPVTVLADRTAEDSVSAAAAALWFPYRSGQPSLGTWLARSLLRSTELAPTRTPAWTCARAWSWSGTRAAPTGRGRRRSPVTGRPRRRSCRPGRWPASGRPSRCSPSRPTCPGCWRAATAKGPGS